MSEKKITFGRIFWPSLVAILIASIISLVLFFIGLGGLIGGLSESKPFQVEDNSVLHLTLNGQIGEAGSTKFDQSTLSLNSKVGLSDLLFGFEKAKKDDRIKGVFVEIGNIECGYATAKEIRDAINDFEKSGKFVVSYNSGELVSLKEYYISSAAKEVYGFPSSTMTFVGLGSELSFFKGTLDMLDIEMQVIRGKNNDFKSAVEPYFRTDISDSSRVQMERYLTSIWSEIRNEIGSDRKIAPEKLNEYAENGVIHRVDDAVKYKMIDALKYRDEVIRLIKKKAKVAESDKLELASFEKYAKKGLTDKQVIESINANIAVILAEGDVSTDGDGLSSKKICQYVREANDDKNIKIIVLRINSPGGSALASDEIWREVKLANKKKKVIVSMGDVAASGGYYIATPAYKIFADPTTITGSIGVFGVIPYTGKMLENKLGLTFDRVQTNKHAVMSTNRKLNEEELKIIQEEVDEIYDDFLSRVAEGRGMTKEQVNRIARGRVWTGVDAKRIGLVDELGGINAAIAFAKKQAKLSEAKIKYWPEKKEDPIETILEQLGEDEAQAKIEANKLPESLKTYYKQLQRLENLQGIQMRLPFEYQMK